jgi:hypothetical protein
MITRIVHHDDGRDVTVQVVARPLTDDAAAAIRDELLHAGIDVVPAVVNGVVHLWEQAELDTRQEVAALRAVMDRSDSPVARHPAVTS